jgi:hypothetical protein
MHLDDQGCFQESVAVQSHQLLHDVYIVSWSGDDTPVKTGQAPHCPLADQPPFLDCFPKRSEHTIRRKTAVNGESMFIFKLGLLTCAFYVALTMLLEAGLWGLAYFKGFGIFYAARDWFWGVGLRLGLIFGTLWAVSFTAAWCIVYASLKAKLPIHPS